MNMSKLTQEKFDKAYFSHQRWLKGEEGGERMDLHNKDLRGIIFVNSANLEWANLKGTDLSGANLEGADLKWAQLNGANLSGADLEDANLSAYQIRLSKHEL